MLGRRNLDELVSEIRGDPLPGPANPAAEAPPHFSANSYIFHLPGVGSGSAAGPGPPQGPQVGAPTLLCL